MRRIISVLAVTALMAALVAAGAAPAMAQSINGYLNDYLQTANSGGYYVPGSSLVGTPYDTGDPFLNSLQGISMGASQEQAYLENYVAPEVFYNRAWAQLECYETGALYVNGYYCGQFY